MSCCHRNKLAQTWRLKATQIYSLPVTAARSPGSVSWPGGECQGARRPVLAERLFPASPSFLNLPTFPGLWLFPHTPPTLFSISSSPTVPLISCFLFRRIPEMIVNRLDHLGLPPHIPNCNLNTFTKSLWPHKRTSMGCVCYDTNLRMWPCLSADHS